MAQIGKTVVVVVGWQMDQDEKYPDEYALLPWDKEAHQVFHDMGITWIASGDVTIDERKSHAEES